MQGHLSRKQIGLQDLKFTIYITRPAKGGVSMWIVGIRARVFEKIGIGSSCMYVCGESVLEAR
jgi:hypothetical protein